MWNSIKKTDEPQDDYIKYIKASDYGYKAVNNNQYVVPYADSPLNNNRSLKMFILILLREPSIIFTLQHHICLLQKRCPESLQWQQ